MSRIVYIGEAFELFRSAIATRMKQRIKTKLTMIEALYDFSFNWLLKHYQDSDTKMIKTDFSNEQTPLTTLLKKILCWTEKASTLK